MRVNFNIPDLTLNLTPMTKAFLTGMLLGCAYGVIYAVYQGVTGETAANGR